MEYDTCPRHLISPRSAFLLQLYAHYKNGILPFGGGLLDQPNAYVEAMTLIEHEAQDGAG